MTYLALRLLGYENGPNYDGSMADAAVEPKLPIKLGP